MSDTSTRPAPPPLEYRTPLCSVCGGETTPDPDGGFDCTGCYAYWTDDYWRPGEWADPQAKQCAASVSPHEDNTWIPAADPRKHTSYNCFRDSGHDGEHANPEMSAFVKGWA